MQKVGKVVTAVVSLAAVFGGVAGINDVIHNGVDAGYSNGVRNVTAVQKESWKGVFDKSCEVQTVLPGFVDSGNNSSTNVWSVSVLNPGVAKALASDLANGNKLKIEYKQFLIEPYRLKSQYVAVAVKAVSGPDQAAGFVSVYRECGNGSVFFGCAGIV